MTQTFDKEKDYRNKQDFEKRLSENYDQIRQISSGGGGIIYSAVHRRLNQKVVLKKIRTDKIDAIGKKREMEILLNLKHTYLPQILDFWSYEDEIYTVMEFVEGRSFQELLDEGMTFSQKDVIRWTRQLAEVLEYLHNSEKHIIHGDIKPANLMLTPQNNICLIDFNVSVLMGDNSGDPTIGYSEGYAPAEQLIQYEEGLKKNRLKRMLQASSMPDSLSSGDTDVWRPDEDDTDIASDEDDTDIASDDDDTDIASDQDDTDVASADDDTDVGDAGDPVLARPVTAADAKSQRRKKLEEEAEKLTRKYGSSLKIDGRTDIYSACATMYQILTGKKPLPCYAAAQAPVEKLVPSVNDAFAHILMHGMEQNPANRFQNASQFLKALQQIVRSTKRYKRMLLRQDLAVVAVLICFFASCAAAVVGWQLKDSEAFSSYLKNAGEMYLECQYQETLDYLDEYIMNNGAFQEQDGFSDAYYLQGCCYLELGDEEKAAASLQSAIFLDSGRPEYYRDYGIALARTGNMERARAALDQAKAKGLATDGISLLEGEIALKEKDFAAAESSLNACLSSLDDAIRMRAVLKLDEVYQEMYGEESYDIRIFLLEAAAAGLPDVRKPAVWEALVQAASDGAEITGDVSYTDKAVSILDEMIDSGYATLAAWMNKGVLLQSKADYEGARAAFLSAEQTFPGTYLVSKRLAFLEFDCQSAKSAEERDYTLFEQYYQESRQRYEQGGSDREQDAEMEYLEILRQELVSTGWLGEK